MNNYAGAPFQERLEKSHRAVWRVAYWFWRKGREVSIPKKFLDGPDQGDLFVNGDRVEVKHKDVAFTDAADFPFNDVLLGEVNSFDRADPKPVSYILVNRDLTHCLIVLCKDSQTWTTRTVRDRKRYDCVQQYYVSTLDKAYFRGFV